MLAAFGKIPGPLQKQTLIRLGFGALFSVLLIVLLFTVRDVLLLLPCAGAAVLFVTAAITLFRRAARGAYTVVVGECREVGVTAAGRRAKHILLQTEEHTIRVALCGRMRKIPVGAAVNLYVADNTPVYEKDGVQMLYHYLAIEIKGEAKNHDRHG
jgi:hypothetical protein